MMSAFAKSFIFENMEAISERLTYDSFGYNASLHINGTGSGMSSQHRNYFIAQHNDRMLMIAKTHLFWDGFVNFTK